MPELESRKRFGELLDLLGEVSRSYVVAKPGMDDADVAEGFRYVTHVLQSALYAHQEFDPERPVFHRIVSPTRSFSGDNPDALYFEAAVAPDREYVVRGNLAGAVYTSFTIEAGAAGGAYPTGTAGVLRDDDIDVDDDGGYEIRFGGQPAERNWLAIPPDGGRITTRHYFEWPQPAASSQSLHVPLSIEATEPTPPPPRWDDDRVAAGLDRVIAHVRGKTLEHPDNSDPPPFVSIVPNVLPRPDWAGTIALSAMDAMYCMAPYLIGPDDALVITGRWPEGRFSNVCLWNRWLQMYDYTNRQVSRNRANTTLEPDGSFRLVLAHEDPGVPNWLDTEGRPIGTIFFRYFLPEGDVEPPVAELVKRRDLG